MKCPFCDAEVAEGEHCEECGTSWNIIDEHRKD
jgi:methionyl-tRNA synthetase